MSVVMVTKRKFCTDVWQWQVENFDLQLNLDGSSVSSVGNVESDIFTAAKGTACETRWKIILRAFEGYDCKKRMQTPLSFQVGLEFLGGINDGSIGPIEAVQRATGHYEIKLAGGDGEQFFLATNTTTFVLGQAPPDTGPGSWAGAVESKKYPSHFLDVMPFDQLSTRRRQLFSANKLTVSVKLTSIFDIAHEKQTFQHNTLPDSPSSSSWSSSTGKKNDENLGHCFGQLVAQKKLSDVQIMCGGQKFFAHRVILSARSSVLCSMLDIKNLQQVNIDDLDIPTLQRMLKYIYSGDGNVDNLTDDFDTDCPSLGGGDTNHDNKQQALFNLLDCADKYDLQGLKASCLDKICDSLSDDNVAKFALIAHKYKAGPEWMSVIQGYCLRRHATLMKNAKYRKIYCQNPEAFVGDVDKDDELIIK